MKSPETSGSEWLAGFPRPMQSTVENYYKYAVNNGCTTPAEVVTRVQSVVQNKLEWALETATRERCHALLVRLRCDYHGALQFAASMLATAGK
jgi:hypothetical protein